MTSPFDLLVDLIHSETLDSWKDRNEAALGALFGTRYPKRAEKALTLRAPDMRGGDGGVPYAAYIHPSNPDAGAFGGMSFVIFPADDEPCLVGMVIGTQGLAPDEAILGRPGHIRKMQAICRWLNEEYGSGAQVAWSKQDPTRVDIDAPKTLQDGWSAYDRVFKRYGKVVYALYKPTKDDRAGTTAAVTAMLDVMFEERGHVPMKEWQADSESVQSAWLAHLLPSVSQRSVVELLQRRRYVVLQGPPGTGKTRLSREILTGPYHDFGRSIQFHPNTTYENFIGGLAPVETANDDNLGFRFSSRPGFLMEAAREASENPAKPYLLHIDEINRADLGKILGEAIYLFEPEPESERRIDLAYDFGAPFHRTLHLPRNLHILGTMNSADRSIAIVDLAVRRRFAFLSMWPDLRVVEEHGCDLSRRAFRQLTSLFVEHAPDDVLALMPGHSYFLSAHETCARIDLRTNLAPLLHEYLAQGYVAGFAEAVRGYLQWLESQ